LRVRHQSATNPAKVNTAHQTPAIGPDQRRAVPSPPGASATGRDATALSAPCAAVPQFPFLTAQPDPSASSTDAGETCDSGCAGTVLATPPAFRSRTGNLPFRIDTASAMPLCATALPPSTTSPFPAAPRPTAEPPVRDLAGEPANALCAGRGSFSTKPDSSTRSSAPVENSARCARVAPSCCMSRICTQATATHAISSAADVMRYRPLLKSPSGGKSPLPRPPRSAQRSRSGAPSRGSASCLRCPSRLRHPDRPRATSSGTPAP
jgi:hypothetical protein